MAVVMQLLSSIFGSFFDIFANKRKLKQSTKCEGDDNCITGSSTKSGKIMTDQCGLDVKDLAYSKPRVSDAVDCASANHVHSGEYGTRQADMLARLDYLEQQLADIKACMDEKTENKRPGNEMVLRESYQCAEDIEKDQPALTSPVVYAVGNRLFTCSALYTDSHATNSIISYVYHNEVNRSTDKYDEDEVSEAGYICPFCSQFIPGRVSRAEYEQHVRSHLDSDDEIYD